MKKRSPIEISYFGIQAYTGTTKHMGGLASTQEMIELCGIGEGMHVLDVGCGVGATAVHLVRQHGCHVTGVDLSPRMIERAHERAEAEGIQNLVVFKTGDVRELPFDSGRFDAVICESVLTFVANKAAAIAELARVTKPGGRVGLNEETWLKTPVPSEMITYTHNTWQIEHDVPTSEVWEAWMKDGGLKEIRSRILAFDTRRESTQVSRYRWRHMWLMTVRSLKLFISNPEFRQYTKDRRGLPKGLFDYLGYGLYVGRK
jgi:cyclopropane fatty-acyl-phospholipid synthase-like methyltransferase